VNLVIYNNMGQVVATILDESLEKGVHQVMWDSKVLSPGIYFYRLSTAICQLSTTRKLVVVR
jgi:flagellar hook assembly protein FlgD